MENGKVLGMSHIAFRCKDLEKSYHFYKDILGGEAGFELLYSEFFAFKKGEAGKAGKELDPDFVSKFGTKGDLPWIKYVKFGSVFVELFDAGPATDYVHPDDRVFNYQHFSLEVDDIHAFTERIRKAGAVIVSEPAMGMEHTWQMWAEDPDQNQIEFMQYTPKSYQVVGKERIEYR